MLLVQMLKPGGDTLKVEISKRGDVSCCVNDWVVFSNIVFPLLEASRGCIFGNFLDVSEEFFGVS